MRTPGEGRLGTSAAGRATWRTAPSPAPFSAQIRPPWAWTMVRAIDSPRPIPVRFVLKNESKSFGRCSGAIPCAAVADADQGAVRFGLDGDEDRAPLFGHTCNRVHGVEQEDRDDLLDLDPVTDDRDRVRRGPDVDRHLSSPCLGAQASARPRAPLR